MRENILFYTDILKDLAPLIISLIAIWLTSRYQKHTQKLADDRMMKDLFTEFNQRYDLINNKLDIISKLSIEEWNGLKAKDREKKEGVVIDFFNICAEEYYWHKEGRINGNIWVSWNKGMNDIFNKSKVIQGLWAEECENEGYKSYYISHKNEIFRKA
ncbi:hypothetical protein SAMN04488104_101618 [Algoriphagus faecimaris]|uniref:Uncharacterized protein n=1 Tax=Algoriphagus faecimaris TaxID=686796 RepID=A0A1G6S9S1_9BACT|nr:hypothetical protein [Algoriphagus faecimaris]SDD13589.1 hypothetical protein SAMN04488104_101618 [Algoriphagus faecimaris]